MSFNRLTLSVPTFPRRDLEDLGVKSKCSRANVAVTTSHEVAVGLLITCSVKTITHLRYGLDGPLYYIYLLKYILIALLCHIHFTRNIILVTSIYSYLLWNAVMNQNNAWASILNWGIQFYLEKKTFKWHKSCSIYQVKVFLVVLLFAVLLLERTIYCNI